MDWQQILVFVIVAGAVFYLARGYFGRKKGACGGCSTCPSTAASDESVSSRTQLVQLDLAPPKPRTGGGT